MSADEFVKWSSTLDAAPVDADGDSPRAELAWRAMNSIVENMENYRPGDIEDAAREIATGISWAAFWIAAGAVIATAIVRLA